MAKIIVFEDGPKILKIIGEELRNHEIVATGQTLSQAFAILGQLACGEVEADIILLDGNLKSERHDPVYHFEPTFPATPLPKNRQLTQRPGVTNSQENVIRGSSYEEPGRDAKAIVAIMQRCDITAKIIGISGDSMDDFGVEVDYDLTKDNFSQLADIVDLLVPPKIG